MLCDGGLERAEDAPVPALRADRDKGAKSIGRLSAGSNRVTVINIQTRVVGA